MCPDVGMIYNPGTSPIQPEVGLRAVRHVAHAPVRCARKGRCN
jgi:hypothetical protein